MRPRFNRYLRNMLRLFCFLVLLTVSPAAVCQPRVIDKVIGVVGKYPVLLSDLQNAMLERDKEGLSADQCLAFEMLVYQKLLVAQAIATA